MPEWLRILTGREETTKKEIGLIAEYNDIRFNIDMEIKNLEDSHRQISNLTSLGKRRIEEFRDRRNHIDHIMTNKIPKTTEEKIEKRTKAIKMLRELKIDIDRFNPNKYLG